MRIFKSLVITGLSLGFLSANASALSCMRPDIAQTMEKAKQSETLYYILVGTLSSDKPIKRRTTDIENQFEDRPPELTRVQFKGHSLAQRQSWDVNLHNFDMNVETRCFGPWCSNVPVTEETQIFFVDANPGGLPVLRISPCPEMVFYSDPKGKTINKLRTCFDKDCVSDQKVYR